jgi:hypothetical protein
LGTVFEGQAEEPLVNLLLDGAVELVGDEIVEEGRGKDSGEQLGREPDCQLVALGFGHWLGVVEADEVELIGFELLAVAVDASEHYPQDFKDEPF